MIRWDSLQGAPPAAAVVKPKKNRLPTVRWLLR
jgi:hypothetical protein